MEVNSWGSHQTIFFMGVSNDFPLLWLLCLMTPEGILKLTQEEAGGAHHPIYG